MGGQVVERQKKGSGKGLRRPKRRIAILIDMTPMVDIAFLLLIFYMVSTVFSMPQAMEINLPSADDEKVEIIVKESNLLSLRVDEESRFWWNMKTPTPDNLPLLLPSDPAVHDSLGYSLYSDTLRNLLVNKNRDNARLSTLILIHRDAEYADMVNILDEIDVIERSWNHRIAQDLDKKVEELTKADGKFSYRYAMGEWEPRDDKILEAAVTQATERGEL